MSKLDLITIEVLWNRLLSVANEQQSALMRTAFSTIVRESQDLACAAFDTRGRMIAQSITGTPGHINPMATGVKHFLAAYPGHTLRPGDVLITNDPWQTAGQMNDFTVLNPVFLDGVLVGYFANCCHSADVGGRVLSGEANEIYEEGLRVPITKLFDRGEPNHELIKLIRANVRTPDETVGDLYAQTSCNDVGGRSLINMMREFKLESIDPLADEILSRSERAMRDAIRKLPNGRYTSEIWNDGFEEPIKICTTVTIEDEDIYIDFSGSSPQSKRSINVVLNYTHGYASFAMKAAVTPEVPHNHGSFTPVHVSAPEGSILNCRQPAAVGSRHLVGHFIPGAIFAALAPAMPGKLLAGGADPIWMNIYRGYWPAAKADAPGAPREPFMLTAFQLGGTGARAIKDGLNTTGFPSGVAGIPAEVIETLTPLVQHQRTLRTDSGGAGEQRGGLGQVTEISCRTGEFTVSAVIDRTKFAAPGFEGGAAGGMGSLRVQDRVLQPKRVHTVADGEHLTYQTPGGGGYGRANLRMPERVLADVIGGYVSIEQAARQYGVAIDYLGTPDQRVRMPSDFQIDWRETGRLRASMLV